MGTVTLQNILADLKAWPKPFNQQHFKGGQEKPCCTTGCCTTGQREPFLNFEKLHAHGGFEKLYRSWNWQLSAGPMKTLPCTDRQCPAAAIASKAETSARLKNSFFYDAGHRECPIVLSANQAKQLKQIMSEIDKAKKPSDIKQHTNSWCKQLQELSRELDEDNAAGRRLKQIMSEIDEAKKTSDITQHTNSWFKQLHELSRELYDDNAAGIQNAAAKAVAEEESDAMVATRTNLPR